MIKQAESVFERDYGAVFFRTKIEHHFRFLDLPIEIRLMIYEKVLLEKPDLLQYYGKDADIEAYDWESFTKKDWQGWYEGAWEIEDGPFRPEFNVTYDWQLLSRPKVRVLALEKAFKKGHTNILATCRQINDEASDIFYGTPEFVFENTNGLYNFLYTIGTNRAHMRRITVSRQTAYDSLHPACRLLTEAAKLQSLDLCVSWMQMRHSSRRYFEVLKPLYAMLCEREQDYDEAIKVIGFKHPTCTCRMEAGQMHNCGRPDHEENPLNQLCDIVLKLLQLWYDKDSAKKLKRKEMDAAKASKGSRKRSKRGSWVDEDFAAPPLKRASLLASPDVKPSRKLPGRNARRKTDYSGLADNSSDDDDNDGDDEPEFMKDLE